MHQNTPTPESTAGKMGLKPLAIAALIAGGAFQPILPVLAQATAGDIIRNTATATYQDSQGNNLTAESNTVEITVAEVAGITIDPGLAQLNEAPNSAAPGNPEQGDNQIDPDDILYADFVITNVGNDTTEFVIPDAPGEVVGATFNAATIGPIQIIAVNGTALGTAVDVTTAADTNTLLSGFAANDGYFAPGETLTVRVPVQVTANTSGAPIRVRLGDTPPNDNSADTQNQPVTSGTNDVITQDIPNGEIPAEASGTPVNGEREASAFVETFLASTPRAFATIFKEADATSVTAPSADITYNLSLEVENNSPDSSFTAADLEGTTVTVDGTATSDVILVSDVVPTGTTFTDGVNTINAPNANWTPVYSDNDPSTAGDTALEVDWQTDPTSLTGPITRIGFIYDANTNGAIARGTTITGFTFEVTTDASLDSGGTVANIAQIFGQTDPANPNDLLVFDESGDQNANNYDGSTPGTFSSVTPSDFNTNATETNGAGVADTAAHGTDDNTNSGSGADGEDNVVTVVAAGTSLLNGPDSAPAAVGPTDNNDDFTNLATEITAAEAAAEAIASDKTVTFTNTIENTSAVTLTDVLVRPTPPATASDLPVNTLVTITVDGNTGTYEYDGTAFTFVSGTPTKISSLAAGVDISYTVVVTLPNGTDLSTNDTVLAGYPVPITAFVDSDPPGIEGPDGVFNPAEDTTFNTTIDRVYLGYLKLLKEARIVASDGTTELAGYTTDGSTLVNFAQPGNIIEYRVSYVNISETETGSDNVLLDAENTVIIEDGDDDRGTPGDTTDDNTWFTFTTDATGTTTAPGSAVATQGTIGVTPTSGDIEIYTNTVGTVVPSGPFTTLTQSDYSGNLTFQRQIDDAQ